MRVQYVSEKGSENFDSVDDFVAAANRLGLTADGLIGDNPRNRGLEGLPKFKELCGPMGPQKDGTEVRYETWKAYEIYSS